MTKFLNLGYTSNNEQSQDISVELSILRVQSSYSVFFAYVETMSSNFKEALFPKLEDVL